METHSEVERLQHVYREYNLRGLGRSKWSPANRGNQAIRDECQARLGEALRRSGFLPLTNRRVLDVGCGSGARLAAFEDMGAHAENLFGIDLIPERINAARNNYEGITFKLANAESIPFGDGLFDLVAVFTVFTSILNPQMAANVSAEITRVLTPGGGVIWYDFRMNNPANRNVHGISRRQIRKLFPGFKLNLERISLLPPLARRLGRMTNLLYPVMSSFPFLRTHYLGILIKP